MNPLFASIPLYIIGYSFYIVGLKPFKNRMILFFWINIFAYLAYLAIYFVKNIVLSHELHPVQNLIHEFTFTNVPLYFLMGVFWVGSLIVFNYLLEHYDVSLVTPVTEISILFTTLWFIMLGSHFSWGILISVTVVFIGALISAFDTLSLKDPLGPLKRLPHALLLGGFIQSLLESGSQAVTFLCTQKTNITTEILGWANYKLHYLHSRPFSFHDPFYYNVGVRFFIVVVFLLYALVYKKIGWKLLTVLKENFLYIAVIGTAFCVSIIFYHVSFFYIQEKHVLTSLGKLSIPLILIIGHVLLKEKVTQPKVLGCAIILLGGVLSLVL